MNKEKLIDWLRNKKVALRRPGGCSVMHESINSEKVNLINEIISFIQSEPEETKGVDAWIPVTERLPENDKPVLTCDLYGNIYIVNHIKEYRHPFNISPENKRYYEPIAWMPRPEPYDALEAGIKRVLDREHDRISNK
jgi:hypothetical protein